MIVNKTPYTIEDCLFAKQELINMALNKEHDFYLHDASYSENYLHNEPMVNCNDDNCISALELYNHKCCSQQDDDNMIEFYMGKGLLKI